MKIHNSLHKNFNKKKELVANDGTIKFNNKKSGIDGKGRTNSSQRWLRRQINDPFANAAKIEGYLARSAYKLLEIQNKYKIFNKNIKIVIDLGCSPGSWSQVVLTNKNSANKQVIALDILPIKFQHKNLYFIQGDFESQEVQKQLIDQLKELTNSKTKKDAKADCVICDIAMNAIGNAEIDRIRSERILETALLFCHKHLADGGNFVCKAIKGADVAIIEDMRKTFKFVDRFKPQSSRKDSSELFLVGICKKIDFENS